MELLTHRHWFELWLHKYSQIAARLSRKSARETSQESQKCFCRTVWIFCLCRRWEVDLHRLLCCKLRSLTPEVRSERFACEMKWRDRETPSMILGHRTQRFAAGAKRKKKQRWSILSVCAINSKLTLSWAKEINLGTTLRWLATRKDGEMYRTSQMALAWKRTRPRTVHPPSTAAVFSWCNKITVDFSSCERRKTLKTKKFRKLFSRKV